jgi:hypothetical protein
MKRSVVKRFAAGIGAAMAFAALVTVTTQANAASGRGLIGGMSAAEVMGWPDGYAGPAVDYPATASYVRPLGPPPGCVVRQQRIWEGYYWRWRKLRICH